jgi:DNA-binding protein H-NS
MSETMKMLLNLRSLRAMTKENSIDELNEALQVLRTVVKERQIQKVKQYKAEKEKREKLELYRKMLLTDGIAPFELLACLKAKTKVKQKRDLRPAKYRFTDDNGVSQTWTGQGRTPKSLQGKKLETFII